MSAVDLPAWFFPAACTLTLSTNQRVGASAGGGSEQAVDLMNDRWLMSVSLPPTTMRKGGRYDAFLAGMRGQVNWTGLYHFARELPQGTARGAQQLGSNAAQGSASIYVGYVAPVDGTYLAGDMLGIGGLLLMCAQDCVASGGNVTVPLVNRLRKPLTAGMPVTWYRPTAPFRLLSHTGTNFTPGFASGPTLEFGEAIGV